MPYIDFRSDTVTVPTPDMLKAMINAEVGDDVLGEDPTANKLESYVADLLGKEAAVFAPSGTQSNLIGIMAHCERGDEYIVGQQAHTYKWEGGGAAVLGSIQPQPLDFEKDGSLCLKKVKASIKPDDFHHPHSKLLCLENTQAGKVLPMTYLKEMHIFCKETGLSSHLDGARMFNAAVKLGIPTSDIAQYFDTVSICLSKGLGAPIGSVLCGPKDLMQRARRWRKVLGGGMRQVGIIAAAGLYALEHNIDRLAQDHSNAELLAKGLSEIDELSVEIDNLQTNILFVSIPHDKAKHLKDYLQARSIIIPAGERIRLVTHLGISEQDVKQAVQEIKQFFSNKEHVNNSESTEAKYNQVLY